jgi:predicted lipase
MAHQPGAVESVSYLTNIEQTSSVTPPPAQRVRETRYEVCKNPVINYAETYAVNSRFFIFEGSGENEHKMYENEKSEKPLF